MHFLLTTTLFFLAFLLLGILIQRVHRRKLRAVESSRERGLDQQRELFLSIVNQVARERDEARRELKHFAERHQNLLTNANRVVRDLIRRKNAEMQNLRVSRMKLIEETNKLRARVFALNVIVERLKSKRAKKKTS